ncbi:MAG: helix-turn-helix transcriptional regulator [Anaerotignum sp.]|nr:helix-turn-helix transcriptional regulator [Anaerotignum sp.]
MTEFAINLKRFRKQRNLTQTELGKQLNYGSTAIANYETGRNEPSLDVLIKLSEILDVTPNDLLGFPVVEKELEILYSFQELPSEKQKIIIDMINALQS